MLLTSCASGMVSMLNIEPNSKTLDAEASVYDTEEEVRFSDCVNVWHTHVYGSYKYT